jgi:hypothetical protein
MCWDIDRENGDLGGVSGFAGNQALRLTLGAKTF